MYKTIFPDPSYGPGIIAFDTETHLIGPDSVIPRLVCVTACESKSYDTEWDEIIVSTGDRDDLLEYVHAIFDDESVIKVAQNTKFDLGVLCKYDPELIPKVFREIEYGRVTDTALRERLFNLTIRGDIDNLPSGRKASYSLATLVKKYFNEDLSASKTDPDAWRLRYSELDEISVSEWPSSAVKYAEDDARYVAAIYWVQDT